MTRDAVLAILRQEMGYVSGERISSLLGISRTAVNTAVKTLRAEGYEILSATNRGYCLGQVPDLLTAGELGVYLPAERMTSVHCMESVDSTNNYIRDMAFHGAPDGQIVIANEQTGGRGRRGRTFESPKDSGIYLSMLFRPQSLPSDMPVITAWTAVAVNNAIEAVYGIRCGIKWVNDLLLNHRKICGILTEMSIESESGHVEHVIIGIGLNVKEASADFPEELKRIATSIAAETGQSVRRAQLAAEVVKQLDRMRSMWPHAGAEYLKAYRADDITVGQELTVVSGTEEKPGTALAITDDFALRVGYADGSGEVLSSGEVSIRGLYGSR